MSAPTTTQDNTNEGELILTCWAYLDTWRECEILDADNDTQTVKVETRDSSHLYPVLVPFTRVESVCLKWSKSNRIEQYHGRPRPRADLETVAAVRFDIFAE